MTVNHVSVYLAVAALRVFVGLLTPNASLRTQVRSIKFTEFNNGVDPELHPTTVKLYVNRENLGFEDIDDVDATQEFVLTPEDLRESSDPIPLKFVKFQRVRSITFFIEENNGGEITALGSLKLFGRPIATTNMSDFKKNPNQM